MRITPQGIVTQDGAYDFDVIIYATGYDAIVGALSRIEITGTDGQKLNDVWRRDGVKTQLGLQVVGFPNLFMLIGPQSGTLFCNMPRCSTNAIEWLSEMLVATRDKGITQIAATQSAQEQWAKDCSELMNVTLIGSTNSWFTGINTNIEGRTSREALLYAGGNPSFRDLCAELAANDYEGFELS